MKTISLLHVILAALFLGSCHRPVALDQSGNSNSGHLFNQTYREANLNRIAFPIGGLVSGKELPLQVL